MSVRAVIQLGTYHLSQSTTRTTHQRKVTPWSTVGLAFPQRTNSLKRHRSPQNLTSAPCSRCEIFRPGLRTMDSWTYGTSTVGRQPCKCTGVRAGAAHRWARRLIHMSPSSIHADFPKCILITALGKLPRSSCGRPCIIGVFSRRWSVIKSHSVYHTNYLVFQRKNADPVRPFECMFAIEVYCFIIVFPPFPILCIVLTRAFPQYAIRFSNMYNIYCLLEDVQQFRVMSSFYSSVFSQSKFCGLWLFELLSPFHWNCSFERYIFRWLISSKVDYTISIDGSY